MTAMSKENVVNVFQSIAGHMKETKAFANQGFFAAVAPVGGSQNMGPNKRNASAPKKRTVA